MIKSQKKLLWILAFLAGTSLPSEGAVVGDTYTYEVSSPVLFHFVPQKLMFYSPFKGNEKSIEEVQNLINAHKEEIMAGNAYLAIEGFCGSYATEAENRKAVKNRTNQVKSYFITNSWMKEEYYRTTNHTTAYKGSRDIVAVFRLVYAEGYVPEHIRKQQEEERMRLEALREQARLDSIAQVQQAAETLARQQAVADSLATAAAAQQAAETNETAREYKLSPWSVKTNLIYDALITPSLEVEYRFNDRWSVNLEGVMAWWHNDNKHKYYQLATISPEARYWFKPQGSRKGHYVGLFGGFAWYDLENGGTGYQGEAEYAGLSYGYMFPVGKYFSFDAGLGLGYMHTQYEKYLPVDGHYAYQETKKMNYWGPLKLKFSFVWHIGQWLDKKGGNQ